LLPDETETDVLVDEPVIEIPVLSDSTISPQHAPAGGKRVALHCFST
jgi:hypothetical protein